MTNKNKSGSELRLNIECLWLSLDNFERYPKEMKDSPKILTNNFHRNSGRLFYYIVDGWMDASTI